MARRSSRMKVGPEHCWVFFILFQLVLAYLDSKKCEERLIVKWPSLTNAFRNSFGWKNPGFRSHLGWAFLSITMISTESCWIMLVPRHPGCHHQMHPAPRKWIAMMLWQNFGTARRVSNNQSGSGHSFTTASVPQRLLFVNDCALHCRDA